MFHIKNKSYLCNLKNRPPIAVLWVQLPIVAMIAQN